MKTMKGKRMDPDGVGVWIVLGWPFGLSSCSSCPFDLVCRRRSRRRHQEVRHLEDLVV